MTDHAVPALNLVDDETPDDDTLQTPYQMTVALLRAEQRRTNDRIAELVQRREDINTEVKRLRDEADRLRRMLAVNS